MQNFTVLSNLWGIMMVPRVLVLVSTLLLVCLDSFSSGQEQQRQQQNQQQGDYNINIVNDKDLENTFNNVERKSL